MTEQIADSREEADAAEFHYARHEAGAPVPEDLPTPSPLQELGEGVKRLKTPSAHQKLATSWNTAKPHQIFAYLYGRHERTGVEVIGALRADAERHSHNLDTMGFRMKASRQASRSM